MIGVGLGVVAKRRYSGFPFALRSFWQRVRDDGGTMQDYNSAISLYRSNNDALLAVSASATKAGKLYSVLPVDGSGDFTVTAANGTRINQIGLIESVATNVPRINWVDGKPYVLRENQMTNIFRNSDPSVTPSQGTITNISFAANDWGIGLSGKVIFGDNSVERTYWNTPSRNAGTYTIGLLIKMGDGLAPVYTINVADGNDFTLVFGGQISSPRIKRIQLIKNNVYLVVATRESTAPSGAFGIQKRTFNTSRIFETSALMVITGEVDLNIYDYIRTTGAIETRDADIISVALPAGTSKVTTNFKTGSPLVDESPTTPYTMPVGEIESVIMED